jgi:hypothetical protein
MLRPKLLMESACGLVPIVWMLLCLSSLSLSRSTTFPAIVVLLLYGFDSFASNAFKLSYFMHACCSCNDACTCTLAFVATSYMVAGRVWNGKASRFLASFSTT